jgi:hypothetical protein
MQLPYNELIAAEFLILLVYFLSAQINSRTKILLFCNLYVTIRGTDGI